MNLFHTRAYLLSILLIQNWIPPLRAIDARAFYFPECAFMVDTISRHKFYTYLQKRAALQLITYKREANQALLKCNEQSMDSEGAQYQSDL